jgi:hypothetical protein
MKMDKISVVISMGDGDKPAPTLMLLLSSVNTEETYEHEFTKTLEQYIIKGKILPENMEIIETPKKNTGFMKVTIPVAIELMKTRIKERELSSLMEETAISYMQQLDPEKHDAMITIVKRK